jgi:MFS family permease
MALLRWNRAFGRVWLGESLSMLGDQIQMVAFAWLILDVSHSASTLAVVLIAATVPRTVLVLVGGAITDRLSPRLVMAASHFARGAIVAALAIIVATHNVRTWELFAVAIAFGVADAFFGPASNTIIPSLVDRSELPKANALVGASEQVSMLLGPVISGILVATGGLTTAFAINAASFFIAGPIMLSVPVQQPTKTQHNVLTDIRAGLGYVIRSSQMRAILVFIAAGSLAYSGLFSVGIPALAKHSGGALTLGAMISAWGFGQLVGTISAARTGLPRRWGLLIIAVIACEVFTLAVLGYFGNPWVVVALFVPLGAFVAYQSDVGLPTWIQSRTPGELLGRVNSIVDLTQQALQPVSLAMMGALAAVDVRAPFWAAAVPMAIAGIVLTCTRAARQLEAA